MALRNVAKTFSLDEQRIEINEIASDLNNAATLDSISVTVNPVGTAGLSYNNTNGIFSYTPPDISQYKPLTNAQISNWDTAYGWGDHSQAGYLTSISSSDTLDSVTGRGAVTTNNIEVGELLASRYTIVDTNTLIYRDGSNTLKIAVAGSNNLDISANVTTMFAGSSANKTALKLNQSGAVELYYDSGKKFETTTNGVTITGALTAGGLTYPTTNGSSGQLLTSDGLGAVTWQSPAGPGAGVVNISDTIPSSPVAGDLWWESDKGRLKVYYEDADSSQWVDASPPLAAGGITDINQIGNVDTTGLATGEFLTYNGTNWTPNDGIVYNTGTSIGLHPQYLVIKTGTGLGLGTGHSSGDPDVFFDWTSSGTTGSLTIAPNTSTIATYDVYLKGSGASGGISILNSGAVELYYGSSGKRLETSVQGVNVTGRVAAEGLILSTGGQIDAAGCTVDFQSATISFSGASIGGLSGEIRDNVDLHLNQTDGTNVLPSDGQVLSWNSTGGGAGTGDYEWVTQSGGGGGGGAETDTLDSVTGRGNITTNNIECGDITTTSAVIGDANAQLYRDGSNTLKIAVAGSNNIDITGNITTMFAGSSANKTVLKLTSSGAAELYYDSNKKFETTATGATVTGSLDLPNVNSYITGGGHNVLQVDSGKTYFYGGTSGVEIRKSDNSAYIVTVDDDGNTVAYGSVSDSKGDLRKIIFKQESSAYTLVAADSGKAIEISSGGITVPVNVFVGGDAITILNDSGSAQTITQGSSVTIFNSGDGTTGNRTLAGRGMATIYFVNSSTCYISGAGLS